MELVYLIFGFIGFLLSIVIAKWIFRIDTIVTKLEHQNALLVRMLKKQGASNEEIRDTLATSHKLKDVLKDKPNAA
jgi:predicted Holliday junction resolvase-like endonuclease